MSKEVASEIQDSTDWKETPLPYLAQVESALRCHVCKDFYTTPMITSCSHTFCSICIRTALTKNGRCPDCRAQEQELKLRHSGVLEELVEAFKNARPQVMDFAKKHAPTMAVPKRPRKQSEVEEDSPQPRKRTRVTRQSSQNAQKTIVSDSNDEDDDYTPEEKPGDKTPEDGMVVCPICWQTVKEDQINGHMDRGCKDPPRIIDNRTTKPSVNNSQSVPEKRPQRLAQINYSMYKDNQLNKKLNDLGLSASGTRVMRENRYTEWVTLWNANCDATKPKKKAELKKTLEAWEKAQNGKGLGSVYGAQIRDKDFDGKGWSEKHVDSFTDLIAKAKKGRVAKAQATTEPIPTPPDSTDTGPPAPIDSSPLKDAVMEELSRSHLNDPDPPGDNQPLSTGNGHNDQSSTERIITSSSQPAKQSAFSGEGASKSKSAAQIRKEENDDFEDEFGFRPTAAQASRLGHSW